MRVNRGSIGRLIGVHVSSIVKWGYQDNLKFFFFFYENILSLMLACKMLLTQNVISWIFKVLFFLDFQSQYKGTNTSSLMAREIPEIFVLVIMIYFKC